MELSPKPPTTKGTPETFYGDVWLDSISRGLPTSHINILAVHFAPGARTAWHSHEGGQTIYVTEGKGRIQSRGERIAELRPGDVVYTPGGEEHWHGADPDHFMTHVALSEATTHWGPHVSDDEYRGPVAQR